MEEFYKMKFNCGPTWEQKRDIKQRREVEKLKEWHTVFLILPRRIRGANECRAFEFVQVQYPNAYITDSTYRPEVKIGDYTLIRTKDGKEYQADRWLNDWHLT